MIVGDKPFDAKRLETWLTKLKGALHVDVGLVVRRVESGLSRVDISQLLVFTAEIAASLATKHPDYSVFAARVAVQNLYRNTDPSFTTNLRKLHEYHSGVKSQPLISDSTMAIADVYQSRLDSAIDNSCDMEFTYFGLQTLMRSYILRIGGKLSETPQQLLMRVSLGIHGNDIDRVIETYKLMSERYFIHATPTLFNSGTPRSQLSSCFLMGIKDDSIEGIFETLKECAMISKYAGGIGLHVSNIRATGSYIGSTNGQAAGLVPMLRVFNNTARYVDQGGNRRPGAISITIEPWHADIAAFLELRKNHGKEEYRARDLFYALWIPDLFMTCVEKNETWYLFSPDTAPGLSDVTGKDFEQLYNRYVDDGKFVSTIPAQKLWNMIMEAQIETGNPSILYKDACNQKSNQKNIGVIKSSNLCTEIIEYSSPDHIAVCNLASLGLPKFVCDDKSFSHEELHRVTKIVARNLNKIIDINFYPLEETEKSNKELRPIAIGVQGLADVFYKMGVPFASKKAKQVNGEIFETIYHAALEASVEMAQENGSYAAYDGSPLSQGILQYEMWGHTPSARWNWQSLKNAIVKHGVRNSLLTAVMPTASTSQILGFTECVEPVTSNIYSRRVLSGEFQVVNSYLVSDLEALGLWNEDIRYRIMADNGSVQNIPEIPQEVRDLYKTVWEISQRTIIDLSADRGPFVDQSQSMNIFLRAPTKKQLTSMHFYGWRCGLKTGMYYLRTMAASSPTPFTIDYDVVKSVRETPVDSRESTPGSKRARYGSVNSSASSSCDMCAA